MVPRHFFTTADRKRSLETRRKNSLAVVSPPEDKNLPFCLARMDEMNLSTVGEEVKAVFASILLEVIENVDEVEPPENLRDLARLANIGKIVFGWDKPNATFALTRCQSGCRPAI